MHKKVLELCKTQDIYQVSPSGLLTYQIWWIQLKNSGMPKMHKLHDQHNVQMKLEQLEYLRSQNTPRRPMITHTYQILEFCINLYMQHTFWSCLIRCANMKWIQLVLWKIQSGHDFVHRQTDGWTDGRTYGRTTWNQYRGFNFIEAGGIMRFDTDI